MEPAGSLRQSGNVLADNIIYLNFFYSFILSIYTFLCFAERQRAAANKTNKMKVSRG